MQKKISVISLLCLRTNYIMHLALEILFKEHNQQSSKQGLAGNTGTGRTA